MAPIYPGSLPYNVECQAVQHQVPFFKVFGMTRPGIEPQFPGPYTSLSILSSLLVWWRLLPIFSITFNLQESRCTFHLIVLFILLFDSDPFSLPSFYIFQFLYSHCILPSSAACRAACTDILDPISPLLPIVHRLWQVFRATTRILT